jgi:hypothetical protein
MRVGVVPVSPQISRHVNVLYHQDCILAVPLAAYSYNL